MNLNELSRAVHAANIKWWQDIDTGAPIERNKWELLALVISELSECLEGERKGAMDDKLPHRKMAEVEMADAKIRLLDFAAGFYIELTEYKLKDPIPKNKGEAIFQIMDTVVRIQSGYTSIWIEVALALIEEYCRKWGYHLESAMREKMKYNATREDHKHEARRIAGGKQF